MDLRTPFSRPRKLILTVIAVQTVSFLVGSLAEGRLELLALLLPSALLAGLVLVLPTGLLEGPVITRRQAYVALALGAAFILLFGLLYALLASLINVQLVYFAAWAVLVIGGGAWAIIWVVRYRILSS